MKRGGDGDLIGLLEAAYAVDQGEQAWLEGIVRAAAPALDRGLGIYAATVDIGAGGRLEVRAIAVSRAAGANASAVADLVRAAAPAVPPRVVLRLLRNPVSTASSALGTSAPWKHPFTAPLAASTGARDACGIIGRNPVGPAVLLCAFLPRVEAPGRRFVERWSRVAAHLAAGVRLQQRLARTPAIDDSKERRPGARLVATADAVLHPGGAVAHARGAADSPAAREHLARAARAIGRARGRLRRSAPDDAIAAWHALVDGRWTLVDHFDKDGRRFLVARPNPPGTERNDALSTRERQVVAYVALGHANKLIAYELGIPQSTVSSLLRSAARKLGAPSRLELVRMLADGAGRTVDGR